MLKGLKVLSSIFILISLSAFGQSAEENRQNTLEMIEKYWKRHNAAATSAFDAKKAMKMHPGGIANENHEFVLDAKWNIEYARAGVLGQTYKKINDGMDVPFDVNQATFEAFLADKNELLAKYIELLNQTKNKRNAMRELVQEHLPKLSEKWTVKSVKSQEYQRIKVLGKTRWAPVAAFVTAFTKTEDEKDFPEEAVAKLDAIRINVMESAIDSQIKALSR